MTSPGIRIARPVVVPLGGVMLGTPTGDEFESIDDDVPLLLLPVRLETRFSGSERRPKLKIRIYPDVIHAVDHAAGLTAEEITLGQTFWRARHSATDDSGRDAARDALLARIAPRRAAWVARSTTPEVRRGVLKFKTLEPATAAEPLRAACLPYRWVAVGFRDDAVVFKSTGKAIAQSLQLAPDPAQAAWSESSDALSVDEHSAWMIDYDRAVDQGMAITVDLSEDRDTAREGLDALFVLGVSRTSPEAAASEVATMLEAHHYTRGLDFAPQGTPTNNTDAVSSDWTRGDWDSSALLDRELVEPTSFGQDTNAARLAAALGLPDSTVLERTSKAADAEEEGARAMNRVIWPATWGEYLGTLLAGARSPALDDSALSFARDWFVDYVRGGSPLPTLRVGAQPYGVLPVRAGVEIETPTEPIHYVEYLTRFLRETWRTSAESVPRMNPDATSATTSEGTLVEILGSHPHAMQFLVRQVVNYRDILTVFFDYTVGLLFPFSPYDGLGQDYHHARTFGDIVDSASELSFLEDLKAQVDDRIANRGDAESAKELIDFLIIIVKAHGLRQPPLGELELPGLGFSGIFASPTDDPEIVYSAYDADGDTKRWTRPIVQGTDVTGDDAAENYLSTLANRVPGTTVRHSGSGILRGSGTQPTGGVPSSKPLLYQILDSVVDDVARTDGSAFRAALHTLGELDHAELELRLRETLGLATHRLDAWVTSLAKERLAAMRDAQPTGIAVGGFGWVENLRPDSTTGAESRGFIHTPSLAHAATAAVLRSGWESRGTSDSVSPLAVNLESRRARVATWVMDGLRQGQALGDMLGCAFERRLHDDHLDAFIDSCRQAALAQSGVAGYPTGPVDGLVLSEAYGDGNLSTVIADAHEGTERDALIAALDALTGDFDSVADIVVAESTHQLLQGNLDRAAAAMDATATGSVPPPEMHVVETPRSGIAVTHRVIVALGTASLEPSLWAATARATFDPALESWVAHVLGDPAMVRCAVTVAGDESHVVSFADLNVAALDAVYEAPLSSSAAETDWARRVASFAYEKWGGSAGAILVDTDGATADAGESVSFQQFGLLCGAVRSLLSRSRDLRATDLALPAEQVGVEPDAEDAETRVAELETKLQAATAALEIAMSSAAEGAESALPDASALRTALLSIAEFGVAGALPNVAASAAGDASTLLADAAAAASRARTRLEQASSQRAGWATSDETSATPSNADRVDRAESLARLLFGGGPPLLPRFVTFTGGDLAAAFAAGLSLTGDDPLCVHGWLQRVAKVRERMGVLDDLASLADYFAGDVRLSFAVAQLPVVEGEGWVAQSAPTAGTGGRLSLVVIDHGATAELAPDTTVAGLVLDEWVERVPSSEQTTGIALHFDAPASRPPQALLVMVPPEGEEWRFDLVRDTLRETLELAKLRLVGPENLVEYGHHIPVTFIPSELDP